MDDVADPAVMYPRNGKLFCRVGGVEIPLRHTRESLAASKAQAKKSGDDWDGATPRRYAARTAAPSPDPKQLARRREANEALATCNDARKRFAAHAQLREQFGAAPTDRPGDPSWEQAEDRFLHQLGTSL